MKHILLILLFCSICYAKDAVIIIDYSSDTSRILFEYQKDSCSLRYMKVHKPAIASSLFGAGRRGLFDTCSSKFNIESSQEKDLNKILRSLRRDYTDTLLFDKDTVSITILLDDDDTILGNPDRLTDSVKIDLIKYLEKKVPSITENVIIDFYRSTLFWAMHFIRNKSKTAIIGPGQCRIARDSYDRYVHTEYSIPHLKPEFSEDDYLSPEEEIDKEIEKIENKLKLIDTLHNE